jgi:predicted RNA methylase
MDESINKIIKNNNVFVTEINQLLHNEGILLDNRLEIIIDILNNSLYETEIVSEISEPLKDKISSIINSVTIDNDEIFQILFMFYCNKNNKINLDQFYTPYTIGKFLCKLMIPGKKVIDPACGTGDLIKSYDGDINLWDVSEDALEICSQNYRLNNKECKISCLNSIIECEKDNGSYDYFVLNPPFGTSTVISETNVLDKYTLGKGKKKEELGILFIERGINLLKNEGIGFIIVPNGYLGNSTKNITALKEYIINLRIISILELPSGTFSRSGTGVSTSIIIIQKIEAIGNYNIFIEKIENIGYILNRKNTPYKYKTENGKYVIKDNKPVLDNDFDECDLKLSYFVENEKIKGMRKDSKKYDYEILNRRDVMNNILDINRYLKKYKSVIDSSKKNEYMKIKDYIVRKPDIKPEIILDNEYLYLDIKQITSPIYSKTNNMYGYDLPSRAKISVRKNDIIVSKLKGKISFTIILDDVDNIICSNGFALLRPKDYDSAVIIFANLFTSEFKIQHNALCTGSIMETISESDIQNIYINPNIDNAKYEGVIDALGVINEL